MACQRCSADEPEPQPDWFRSQLDAMIDRRYNLLKMKHFMPWDTLLACVGDTVSVLPECPGHRSLPARLMLGLRYLEQAYDLSDETICGRWRVPVRLRRGALPHWAAL